MPIKSISFFEFVHLCGDADKLLFLNALGDKDFIQPAYTSIGCQKNNLPVFFGEYVSAQALRRYIMSCKISKCQILTWQWKTGDEKFIKYISLDNTIFLHSNDPYWLKYFPACHDAKLFNVQHNNEKDDMLVYENHIFVGGDSNPSHFFGDIFPIWLAIIASEYLKSLPILAFTMPQWQKDLINTISPGLEIKEISLSLTNSRQPMHISLQNCYVFEDFPQFNGWNIARAFFGEIIPQMATTLKRNSEKKRIYLSRRAYEIHNNLESRVIDFHMVKKILQFCNFSVIYPEEYSIIEIQLMLQDSEYVIADPGSCSIHAFLSPAAGIGKCKTAMLSLPYIRRGEDWDIIRHQELIGLLGDHHTCIYGTPLDTHDGLGPALYYAEIVAWLGKEQLIPQ